MIAILMSSGLRLGGRVGEGSYEKQQAWMDLSLAYQFLRGTVWYPGKDGYPGPIAAGTMGEAALRGRIKHGGGNGGKDT